MWDRLVRITPPTELPVSVADMRAYLNEDRVDQDELVERLIQEAVASIDGPDGLGIVMTPQIWEARFDRFLDVLPLVLAPARSLVAIAYDDADGVERSVPLAQISLVIQGFTAWVERKDAEPWPATRAHGHAVRVRFEAGFAGDDPVLDRLRSAVRYHVAVRYADREGSPFGPTWDALVHPFRRL